MEAYKRQTAYKFWIRDVLGASTRRGKAGFLAFSIRGKDVGRVNLLASVIDKYKNEAKTYSTVTLDDGSGQIRLKAWNEDIKVLSDVPVGSMVLMIGKLSLSNNNEIFIRPEVVKQLGSLAWQRLRRLELEREFGKPEAEAAPDPKVELKERPKPEQPSAIEEEVVEERIDEEPVEPSIAAREKVLAIIEKNSEGDGIGISRVVEESGLDAGLAEKTINDLLQEGEIFQKKPGMVQIT